MGRSNNMTMWILLLILSLAPPAAGQASEAVLAFDRGNQHFREGQYAEALAAYEDALNQGYASGPLYFNMGNAYYRMDELGQAIRFYEKSRLLMPEDPTLLHSLQIARSHTIDQFSQLPRPVWVAAWHRYAERSGGLGLWWLGLLAYLVASGLFAWRILHGKKNPWIRRLWALTTLGALILLVSAFAASIEASSRQTAVILAEETDLREAPQPMAAGTLSIHEGLVVDVLSRQDAWAAVRLPNGVTGWVEAAVLGEI